MDLRWTWLACALVASPAAVRAADEPDTHAQTEVVRITRDFGKPHFSLVIDAWTSPDSKRLHRTRLWWVNTAEEDRRKELGRFTERLVKLEYRRRSRTALNVVVAGDSKEFTFSVELAGDGTLAAYVAVDTDDGKHVPRCRTESARIIARRALGIPIGLGRIAVTCRDGDRLVTGTVRHRDV